MAHSLRDKAAISVNRLRRISARTTTVRALALQARSQPQGYRRMRASVRATSRESFAYFPGVVHCGRLHRQPRPAHRTLSPSSDGWRHLRGGVQPPAMALRAAFCKNVLISDGPHRPNPAPASAPSFSHSPAVALANEFGGADGISRLGAAHPGATAALRSSARRRGTSPVANHPRATMKNRS